MASSDSKITKIQTSFRQLSVEAAALNSASDQFTRTIRALDEAIKKLNVGLTVWVTFNTWASDGPDYSMDQIGYAKVKGEWGIALRSVDVDQIQDLQEETGLWLFSDAPRELRLDAIAKLPELIAALSDAAAKTTEKVTKKMMEAQELAAALGLSSEEGKKATPATRGPK